MQDVSVSKLCGTVIDFFRKTILKVGKAVKFFKRQSKVDTQLFLISYSPQKHLQILLVLHTALLLGSTLRVKKMAMNKVQRGRYYERKASR